MAPPLTPICNRCCICFAFATRAAHEGIGTVVRWRCKREEMASQRGTVPIANRDEREFCVRHDIYPIVEEYPMAEVNEALAHLESGKARFRIVLKN